MGTQPALEGADAAQHEQASASPDARGQPNSSLSHLDADE